MQVVERSIEGNQRGARRPVFFRISPPQATLVLACGIAIAAAGHAGVYAARVVFNVPEERMFGFYRFFNMGAEANLPSYLSALNLLLAAALLVVIAVLEHAKGLGQRVSWWLLSAGFAVMSLDEAAQIHEGLVGNIVNGLTGPRDGIWHYGWYIAYLPVLIVLALVFLPFLKRLPLRHTLRFAFAGGLFVGGAVGIEMVESYLKFHGIRGAGLTRLIEEVLEMSGVVFFIYALLAYLREEHAKLEIDFTGIDLPTRR